MFYVREEGVWRGTSWEKFGADAHALAAGLLASGLGRGAAVCVLMGNVPEWPVCDLGIIVAGGVS
ncbi:MAG: AMP-binding protein [Pyrinomonadaceae bacterium]